MKTLVITLLITCSMLQISAQQFDSKFKLLLPDTTTYDFVQWADFDNDSLLDVIISGKSNNGLSFFSIYKCDTLNGPVHKAILNTNFESSAYTLTDLDADNQIDILITGVMNGDAQTVAYYNRENFAFERDSLLDVGGSIVRLADVDQDGERELLISGTDTAGVFLNIYKGELNRWRLFDDTIQIHATAIETIDFNQDSFIDLLVSGKGVSGKPTTTIYLSIGNFQFSKVQLDKVDGEALVNDMNADGRMDVVLTGTDSAFTSHSWVLRNTCERCFEKDSIPVLNNAKIFTGDLNNDGRLDISMLGTAGSDTINLIRYPDKTYDTLDFKGVHGQTFGDFDRDGDLDLIQLVDSSAVFTLVIAENSTPDENLPPSRPSMPMALMIFDRIFLYWEKSDDDHTASASLTYDVLIQTPGKDLVTGTFDQLHQKRLLVNHGNNGTANYLLVKSEGTSEFGFSIQAVDNAYHAGGSGLCTGGSGDVCMEVIYKSLTACKFEQLTFTSPQTNALWFSFNEGFLGFGNTLNYTFTEPDTIFSAFPGATSGACGVAEAFVIQNSYATKVITMPSRYVCLGSTSTFNVAGGWEQILWSSSKKGFLSNQNSIDFTVTEADTVSVLLSSGTGCAIQQKTAVLISEPVLSIGDEAYQILRGESVQLNVVGGETVVWSPATGLDNTTIHNPMASPRQTTEYSVTITDSVGCTASGKVLVIVEETAFIPNLFTPNDDGKNDEVKAYGLDTVTEFSFSIYNREGSLVYSTNNPADLANVGWNGTAKGAKQPAGVYFWKVNGKNNIGRNLLLNGKNTGSIVLIR